MMKKLTAAALVALLLLLGACKTETSPTKPADSLAPTGGVDATPAPSGGVNPVKGSLRIATWAIDENALSAVEAAWAKQYPNVALTWTAQPDEDAYYSGLQAALISAEAPDILMMQPGARAEQFLSMLEPLAPLAAKMWGENWAEGFYPAAGQAIGAEGECYALPATMTLLPLMAYDVDAFKALGLSSAPATFGELHAAAEGEGADSLSIAALALSTLDYSLLTPMFLSVLEQQSPGMAAAIDAGEASWDDEAVLSALETLEALFQNGSVSAGSLELPLYPTIWDSLSDGGMDGKRHFIAVAADSSCLMDIAQSSVSLGIAPLPGVGDGAGAAAVAKAGFSFALNAQGGNQDLAFAFIAWLCAGEGSSTLAEATYSIPAAKTTVFAPDIPGMKQVLALMQGAIKPLWDSSADARLAVALKDLASGTITAQEAFDSINP